jgi:uncharacterized DUF497 family protein
MIRWSKEKDQWLREHRGVSFQEIANHLIDGHAIACLENPSRAGQEIFVLRLQDYTWAVPFVIEGEDDLFLKTAYPSRKLHKRYGGSHG